MHENMMIVLIQALMDCGVPEKLARSLRDAFDESGDAADFARFVESVEEEYECCGGLTWIL